MCLSDQQCCLASYSKAASTCRIDTSEQCCIETETLDEWRLIHHNSYKERPVDCNDIPDKFQSGVYKVFPNQTQGIDVYCEMNLDEGHWTVFQRRENGSVDFDRGWNEYKLGFGNPKHEFWLGNKNLHSLTSQHNYEMRIDLIDFDGNTAFAKYEVFAIGDESSKFKLTAIGYHGTAGNSLEHHNGHGFSTKDSDNDNHSSHCATVYPGAWWFNACVTSDLNDSNMSSIKPRKRLLEVAKGKRTYQSSSLAHPFKYASKFAVDGRLDTIQHTEKQHLPYWVVDIGTIYNIERVEIYNHQNCCGERLRDLDTLIGPYHNDMKFCAHYAGPSHTGDHLVFKCGGVLPGRYVKLMMRTTEYLHVAEVKVFARIE
ncbi:Fibrinogen-like protein A,Ryncolin-4,Angiopoietin-related protein 7,Angiopoietin-related protein 1,Ficolin-3,Ficolin-1-B,Techylectin-5A,Ficolin-2,Ryncolin-1,Tenascin-R,Fibrinogen-like protein 1,Angiopoietin-1,Tenascin-X,Fibrinogen C domain-containing protein 1-A,Tenascin-N,Ryncolin-3,Tenascin,Fibroleukin,Fibrinogen C domain-containing protein 1,Ryncolin-2,Angiopoietin-related protein 6,Angiopoietin-related protein 2,Angiopoietin-2,Microfibril-associated glycoprotein 4,Ficolin-1-A,Ficolin-1,Fibrinogen C dom|uniref:Fibrinogen C-terminal domain-containing protein n=1 Tax=Mytilus coruscus TaxID=42192 RepID=A0A6J8AWG5_MYTCO|nr:Fibrinogen-like protein A,Ryncolin-4,Angiopoietin-related protein 7,Angiopoietin-related protein 1,Ficolin-3,Ficolin-1-B,Techylectin-5A,Ficolin-2,Ryncolin-1,Tenascin-R,Fibrinogen-like protein 1,Angiopoietin-1,Tenascin-X,Fibrinogen C domain-containing protein 1-A,Tenascin-N,Ryncolin-3,Tenascin,Fibroleukin,Fibrinogen C domain-containing protein 1,Ryncolin-2,Angiopoietin-related protein 6,Angiopoietin-related protein 2,Angiopoietin-2,Microfibril-associated glycoprotein 4,Ficolin-1-A,Ficolin-1,Fibri